LECYALNGKKIIFTLLQPYFFRIYLHMIKFFNFLQEQVIMQEFVWRNNNLIQMGNKFRSK